VLPVAVWQKVGTGGNIFILFYDSPSNIEQQLIINSGTMNIIYENYSKKKLKKYCSITD